jgi:hypothetical protein
LHSASEEEGTRGKGSGWGWIDGKREGGEKVLRILIFFLRIRKSLLPLHSASEGRGKRLKVGGNGKMEREGERK